MSSHPPDMDPVQFGWTKDAISRILIPVTKPEDVPLAPSSVLEMISCKCASKQPYQNAQCRCFAAYLPCSFSADLHARNNPFNKETVESDGNEDDIYNC